MIVSTIKHLSADELGLTVETLHDMVDKSRRMVMQHAMEDVSVENVQALVIMAFDNVR